MLVILAVWILRRSPGDWAAKATAIGALVLALVYSAMTPIEVRSHDVGGHGDYVRFVSEYGVLPGVADFWESFQPPLYYFTMAGLGSIGVAPGDFAFLCFALTVVLFLRNSPSWVAVGLLGLVPAHVFFSARLNNDVMLPLLGAGFLALLERADRRRDSASAAALGGIVLVTLLTKMSGLALFAALLPFAIRWVLAREWKNVAVVLVPGLAFAAIWFARSYSQTGDPFYADVPALPVELRIPNGLARFLAFDFGAYFSQLTANPWGEALRTRIVPYGLVTALQGEFPYAEGFRWIFVLERVLALGIAAWVLIELFRRKNRDLVRGGAFALVAGQLAFYVATNAVNAYSPIQDARYWALAFPAIAALVGAVGMRLDSRRFRAGFFAANLALFASFLAFYEKLLAF